MSPRTSRFAAARNQARTITVCAAAIGCVVAPAVAQAASAATAPHAAGAYHRVVTSTHSNTVKAKHHTAAATTTAATTASVAVATASTTDTYTIKSGDTMYGIAQRSLGSGSQYETLFKLNKGRSEGGGQTLTDAAQIQTGWTLALPDGTSVAAAPAASTSAASSSSSDSGSSSSSSAASSSSSDSSSSSTSSTSSTSYSDDLSGWINQAVSVLAANGYSVSYNAIYETAMNESSGNPNAENGWDSNAAAGTPSIGLLQVIQPTFDAYALSGYGDIWNPVDNIIAGAIYAQDTYGGLDSVVAARCGGSCWSGY